MRYTQNSGYGAGKLHASQTPFKGTGKVFIVGDSGTVNRSQLKELYKVDPDGDVRFFSTIDAAVGECTANAGDVIYVMPGHSETLTGASAITLDVASVTIQGLGRGTDRPTLLLDGSAAVDIVVSANNVSIKNIIFKAGHADIVNVFDLGTAKYFTVEDCEFIENTTNENFLVIATSLDTANANDGLTFRRCVSIQPDTANTNFVSVTEDIDQFVMEDCYISMGVNDSNAIIGMTSGKDLTNARITGNEIYRLNTAGDLLVDSDTANNSGIVADNYIGHADADSEVLVDLTGARTFENYGTAVNDADGYHADGQDS